MKTHINTLENRINEHLSSLPSDKRPESTAIRGQRIQSVAYSSRDQFEATTTNGHAVLISAAEAHAWLPSGAESFSSVGRK